eukprot:scaffold10102_cov124-Isochrysis_galbana.AAC.1
MLTVRAVCVCVWTREHTTALGRAPRDPPYRTINHREKCPGPPGTCGKFRLRSGSGLGVARAMAMTITDKMRWGTRGLVDRARRRVYAQPLALASATQ